MFRHFVDNRDDCDGLLLYSGHALKFELHTSIIYLIANLGMSFLTEVQYSVSISCMFQNQ